MAQEILSSSSPSTSTRSYHVFASFNGDDTRSTLIGHLFKALEEKGIRKFRDDVDLPRGEPISDELVKAIKTSRIAVIVFSKNYASSEWCLDELVEIMENKRSLHQVVMPVFYDVDQTEVREQNGSFAEALAGHEKCVGEDKVKMWKAALTDAAHLPGLAWDSQTSGFEFEFIEEIVKEIFQKLELPLDDSSRDAWSTRILTRISRSIPNSRLLLSSFFF